MILHRKLGLFLLYSEKGEMERVREEGEMEQLAVFHRPEAQTAIWFCFYCIQIQIQRIEEELLLL